MADPDDEKAGSQILPDAPKPDANPASTDNPHEDEDGEKKPSADKDKPDSF